MKKTAAILMTIIGVSANASNSASFGAPASAPNKIIQINLTENEESQLDGLLVKLYGNTNAAIEAKDNLYSKLRNQGKIETHLVIQGNTNCTDTHSDPY